MALHAIPRPPRSRPKKARRVPLLRVDCRRWPQGIDEKTATRLAKQSCDHLYKWLRDAAGKSKPAAMEDSGPNCIATEVEYVVIDGKQHVCTTYECEDDTSYVECEPA